LRAIKDFQGRERRFGGLSGEQPAAPDAMAERDLEEIAVSSQ
jgi:hypothetical protein